jgi:hypothetical protein
VTTDGQINGTDLLSKETAAILDELYQHFKRYLWFPNSTRKAARDVLALYTLLTHVFEAADSIPYLDVPKPSKGCGGTRVLEVLEMVCRNPERADSITAASLYRMLKGLPASQRPTFLLDETHHTFNGVNATPERETLIAIIDSGYRDGGHAIRTNKRTEQPEKFPTYCPKVFTHIGDVLPLTTRSRCVVVRMIPVPDHGRGELHRWKQRFVWASTESLRERIEQWREGALKVLIAQAEDQDYVPTMPAHIKTSDREEELWWMPLQIAELAGEQWTAWALEAAQILKREDEEERSDYALFAHIRQAFAACKTNRNGELHTVQLIKYLVSMPGERRWQNRWGHWADIEGDGSLKARIGKELRKVFDLYSIPPSHEVWHTNTNSNGYAYSDFEEVWASMPQHLLEGHQ